MGKGVYERTVMKLESEARNFVSEKQRQFNDELGKLIDALHKHAYKNLWHTIEKDNAQIKLTECEMWLKRCAEIHGLR
jgi:hypothetical protein